MVRGWEGAPKTHGKRSSTLLSASREQLTRAERQTRALSRSSTRQRFTVTSAEEQGTAPTMQAVTRPRADNGVFRQRKDA